MGGSLLERHAAGWSNDDRGFMAFGAALITTAVILYRAARVT